MKTLIRQKAFETNSSSTHSISLGKNEGKEIVYDTIYPDSYGFLSLRGQDFGWEWEKYNDVETKVAYAVTSINYGLDEDLLKEVIKEHTGATEVIISNYKDNHIDHESTWTCPRDKESLKDFLFNKNSWLFTGNDNSSAEFGFYDVPIYENGLRKDVEYTHLLKIDYINKPVQFKKNPSFEEIKEGIDCLFDHLYGEKVLDVEIGYNSGEFEYSPNDELLEQNKIRLIACHAYPYYLSFEQKIKEEFPDITEEEINERYKIEKEKIESDPKKIRILNFSIYRK